MFSCPIPYALFPRQYIFTIKQDGRFPGFCLRRSRLPRPCCPVVFERMRKKGNYSSGHCSGLAPDSLSAPPRKDGTSPNCGCKGTKISVKRKENKCIFFLEREKFRLKANKRAINKINHKISSPLFHIILSIGAQASKPESFLSERKYLRDSCCCTIRMSRENAKCKNAKMQKCKFANDWSPTGLKGQQLLAQGIALGICDV